ncbi:MAG: protein kinase domain-containing protein [Myxococcota bacterium]
MKVIAEGGMGEIVVARQHPIGRDVAIKRLKADKLSERHRRLLLEEGWITGRLQHPNIIPVYTLGRDDDEQPAIVMKLVEGVTLAEVLEDFDKLPEVFAAESHLESHIQILIHVCNAVSYTHDQGFIHRDIKPSNIMIGEYGEVYLLDWGIALQVGSSHERGVESESAVRAAEGTPAYMAPEMAAPSFCEISRRTDVFLLGACLHEIMTGEPINQGDSYFAVLHDAYLCEPPDYDFDVPDELARIATKALARDPKDRYDSVVAFRKALREFLDYQSAWRLAEVARSKLFLLQEAIDGDEPCSRSELYPLFGACRLGFQKALEVHPGSERASEGLQRAIEVMIEWELDNRGATNAATLLNSLHRPNPELEALVQVAVEKEERQHRASLLTQMSPDAVLGVDDTGTIVYANEQTAEIFGWTAEQLQGQKLEVLIPEAKRAAHVAEREAYQDEPVSRPMDSGMRLEGVRKDGTRVAVDVSLAPVHADGRKLTVASIRAGSPAGQRGDLDRARASTELLDKLSVALFVVKSGRIFWANRAFEDLVGRRDDRLLTGRTVDYFFPHDVFEFPDPEVLQSTVEFGVRGVKARKLDGGEIELDLEFIVPPAGTFVDAVLVEAHPAG